MKFKKIFSVLSIIMLSFAGLVFGCTGKYDKFSIYVEGETSIVLNASSTIETDRTYEVTIKFKNAPNKNCKNVTAKALTPNILSIEPLEKNENYIKFKIAPLENLSSDNLTTDVVFTSAEGNKKCTINVKIVIEISNLLINSNYSPFVVADGNYYAINSSKAFTFEPSNTTQKDITYSLVDPSLEDRFGLDVLEDGRIKVEKLIDNDGQGLSSFEIKATSAYNSNIYKTLTVQVLKELTLEDISIITNGATSDLATKYYQLSEEDYNKLSQIEKEKYLNENFDALKQNGIVLSSNNETKKTSLFQVVLNATSGLMKENLNIYLEKYILTNATIDKNSFLITALNPNVDYLNLVISYKNFDEYKLKLTIPVVVKENATEISVNSSNKTTYDIFDYYDNLLGQPFKVAIGKNNAYDKTFKMELFKEDFNNFVLTYNNMQLNLNDFDEISGKLVSKHNFENNSIIYIKAKLGQNLVNNTTKIKFIANGGIDLANEIELCISEGITSLSFATNKQVLYIAKDENLYLNTTEGLNYKINGYDKGDKLLDKVNLVSSNNNILEIVKDTTGYKYSLKGVSVGTTTIKLVAENGVESDALTVNVYNYSDSSNLDEIFNLEFGANLKKVEDKYYLGLESKTNSANITLKNDKNITINLASIEVLDENVLSAYKVSQDGLIYRLQAFNKGETKVKIVVKIYNENNLVNEDLTKDIEKEIVVKTYYPITDVSLKKDKIEVVDGADLDLDSLQNKLNVLNYSDILSITKNIEENLDDDNLIKIDYNIPNGYSVFNENLATNNVTKDKADIVIGKDYSLTFTFGDKGFSSEGVHSLYITAKVYDILATEYFPVTFKVDVKEQVKPYLIEINEEMGFVYLTNETLFYELKAKVVSESLKEVTNKNLKFETLTNEDLKKEGIRNEVIDENILSVNEEGIITPKASGKTKIKISAKASKYKEDGEYSIYKIVDVIIADGSESLPYILNSEVELQGNKNYTLNSNLNIINSISTFTGSINGDFAYKAYSNNVYSGKYKLFSRLNGVMIETLDGTIQNVDVVIENQNDYSLFVQNNNGTIKNVSLIYNGNFNFNFQDETAIGLIACVNNGKIENCFIEGNLQVSTSNNLIFGGMIGDNYGTILGEYNYFGTRNINTYNASLNIVINTTGGNIVVGGLVGYSYNNSKISNLSSKVVIRSNASVLGGIVGATENVKVENCLFSGLLVSSLDNCKLGGIVGKAINSSLNLCFVQYTFKDTSLGSTEKAFLIGNGYVGGLIGSVEGNEFNLTNSYAQSLVKYGEIKFVADIYATGYVGGLIGLISNNTQANISLAFADVDIFANSSKNNYVGGLIGKAKKFIINNVYSLVQVNYQQNIGGFISSVEDNASSLIENAYTSTARNIANDGNISSNNVYTSDQIYDMISTSKFSSTPWKRDYSVNGGLPYLIFGSYNFLMQEPQSISAKLIANNKVKEGTNYYYGANKNVIIVNDDEKQNKAIIYFTDNLQFENINDLINIVIYPANATYNIASSDTSILSVINGTRIKIHKTGNVTLKIYYSNGQDEISSEIYLSIVNKIENLIVEDSFKILRGKTKQLNLTLSGENCGLEFKFNKDISNNLLYNNAEIENDVIYTKSSRHIFTALKTDELKYTLTPHYEVVFGNEIYKVKDYDFENSNLSFSIETGATGISTNTTNIHLSEKERVSFSVQVENITNEKGLKINIDGNEQKYENDNLNKEISTMLGDIIIVTKVVEEANNKFVVSVSANGKIEEQKVVELKISPLSNENLSVSVLVNLMPSKLLNVELVHYNTISTENGASTIKATPSSSITPGELGVLQINLHPSYANIRKVLVKTEAVNGASIQLAQLAVNDNNELVYVKNNGIEEGALLLDYSTSKITSAGKQFDGNLYVSTILPSNVAINTIFTITVICYDALNSDPITQTIQLKAIPIPGAYLAYNNETNIQMAKGTELILDLIKVNIETEIEPNFEILVNGEKASTEELENIKYSNVYENGIKDPNKILLYVDILNKVSNFEIKTSVRTYINGKIEIVENITKISVVDYVINDAYVENAENSIIENNLGSNTLLKVKLNVTKATENLFIEKRVGETDAEYEERINESRLELERITLRVQALEESISKMSSTFNTVTRNSNNSYTYSNIVPNTQYSNFRTYEQDGYLIVSGTKVSSQQIVLLINYNYDINGYVKLTTTASYEINKNLYLEVKTYTTKDNPSPITTYEQFTQMSEGESYILLNNITLPKDYRPQVANFESLDGNGYTINLQGFSLVESDVNVGVFSEIQENTVVKNIKINILPNIFYLDNVYQYGFELDALGLEQLNFGILCGVNYGVITNCSVANENNLTTKREISVSVKSNENTNIKVSLFVAINEGYITNSRVNNRTKDSQAITLYGKANISGFVVENSNKIASSFATNITLINNSQQLKTAGFVVTNETQIITSFVEGNFLNINGSGQILSGGIGAIGNVGGFVYENKGEIQNSYSNLPITTNMRSAGFVYNNESGKISTCYSASKIQTESSSYRYFTGNNEENIVLNSKGGIVNSYYLSSTLIKGSDATDYEEPANGINGFSEESLEGFICGTNGIWEITETLPLLIDANSTISVQRKLLDGEQLNDETAKIYNYTYVNYNLGTEKNPIIVSNTQEFIDAFTKEENLYSYYLYGRKITTNINYKHIRIVKDIDLSTIVVNGESQDSQEQVQKLQNIIFAGNLNGNGLDVNNIIITAQTTQSANEKYDSFGLFKQVGVDFIYNSDKTTKNNLLDEDGCSVVKNVNFKINSISATITRSVGVLTGEVINSKLYNVSVINNNNVVVTGNNMVGGIAGRISGNSKVSGVYSNVSVLATYSSDAQQNSYVEIESKKINNINYGAIVETEKENSNIGYAGGLFGVVDIYDAKVDVLAETTSNYSKQTMANIIRNFKGDVSIENNHISYAKVYGDVQIIGETVGGLFGYVGTNSAIHDVKFELTESSTQNIIANYSAGGIIGENHGLLNFAVVSSEKYLQEEYDKNKTADELRNMFNYLFSSVSNTATYVGGLVGLNNKGVISYSYNRANIIAKSSRYVGGLVGLFNGGEISYAYTTSNVVAQSEITSNEGYITQLKGYAGGIIGRLNSKLSSNFDISNVVGANNLDAISTKEYNLTYFAGYNAVEQNAQPNNFETATSEISLPSSVGAKLNISASKMKFEDYKNKATRCFSNYKNDNNWDTQNFVFPVLTYNAKAINKAITSEEELRKMTSGGSYILTKDIYLTSPWSPIYGENITLSSAERDSNEIDVHGTRYYKIYNLNILSTQKEVSSNDISGNIGFFSTLKNSNVSNVTFVVGTNYKDPNDSKMAPDRIESHRQIDNSWKDFDEFGILISNKSNTNSSLGVLAGEIRENSTVENISIIAGTNKKNISEYLISTNLTNVGILAGSVTNSKVENIYVNNYSLNNTYENDFAINVTSNNPNNSSKIYCVGGLAGYIGSSSAVKNVIIKNVSISKGYDSSNLGLISGEIKTSKILGISVYNSNLKFDNSGNEIGEIQVGYGFGVVNSLLNDYDNGEQFKFENCSVDIRTSGYVYVGGFAGKLVDSSVFGVDISRNSSIKVETQREGTHAIYVGGLVGLSGTTKDDKYFIKNCSSNGKIELEYNSGVFTYVGGLVGRNGFTEETKTDNKTINSNKVIYKGITIGNADCQTYSKARIYVNKVDTNVFDTKQTTQTIFIGGLVGHNNSKITNVVSLSTIKSLTDETFANKESTISVGIAKQEQTLTTEDKIYFVSELNGVPVRNNEYGENKSYSEILDPSKFEILSFDSDKQTTENSGYSIFNPISLNESNWESVVEELNGKTEDEQEFKYYILSEDIENSETITNFNGVLIGNSNNLTLNATLFNKLGKNALISNLNVISKTSKSNSYDLNLTTECLNSNTTLAIKNEGVVYNVCVVGNLYYQYTQEGNSWQGTNVSSFIIENSNSGAIVNCSAKVNVLVSRNTQSESASEVTNAISGLVNSNDGLILNTFTTSNIEVFDTTRNINYVSNKNKFKNIAGFANSNNKFIIYCYSATTLPDSETPLYAFDGNVKGEKNSGVAYCYFDVNASVSYELDENETYKYSNAEAKQTSEITKDLFNCYSENWQQDNKVNYGYIYNNINNNNTNNILSTFTNDYYEINNVGTLLQIKNILENESEETTSFKFKLVRNINANIVKIDANKISESLTTYEPINFKEKQVEFNGNNFAIKNVSIVNSNENGTLKHENVGLFYAKSTSSTGATTSSTGSIIKNLAVINLQYQIFTLGNEKGNTINIGGIVASGNIALDNCYADGLITTNVNENSKLNTESTLNIGGLCGKTSGEIKNCFSNVKINLKADFISAIGYVGGISGTTSASIINSVSANQVKVKTFNQLYMGGISGKVSANENTFSNLTSLSPVVYDGYYQHYFSENEKLHYNLNAIFGEIDGTISTEQKNTIKYNEKLSLTSDKNITSTKLLNENNFAFKNNSISNEFINTSSKSCVLNSTQGTVLDPIILTEINENTKFENDKNYIVKVEKITLKNVTIGVSEEQKIGEYEFKNGYIIFDYDGKNVEVDIRNEVRLFTSLENAIFSGINFVGDDVSSCVELNGILANKVDNSVINNINATDLYVKDVAGELEDNYSGMLINSLSNSVIANVSINHGHFEAGATRNGIASIIGLAKNSTLFNLKNSATITSASQSETVSGIVAKAINCSLNFIENNGLIYNKNGKVSAGICAEFENSSISFSKNTEKVQVSYSGQKVRASGLVALSKDGEGLKMYYCFNQGNVTSLGTSNSMSAGLVANENSNQTSNILYCYNKGAMVSNGNIYALTNAKAYEENPKHALIDYSYNIGGGYSSSGQASINLTSGQEDINKALVNVDGLMKGNNTGKIYADAIQEAGKYDFEMNTTGDLYFPVIKAIDEIYELKKNENTDAYQISTAFDLYYWLNYVVAGDVDILKDIDMSGYNITPKITEYTGIFNGNNHQISDMRISESETGVAGAKTVYVGFIAKNSGTIKNINFVDPQITNNDKIGTTTYIGVVAGENNGTISNVMISASRDNVEFISSRYQNSHDSISSDTMYIGGIAGLSTSKVENCEVINLYNGATIDVDYKFTNSTNNSYATFNICVGGIVGRINEGGEITNCSHFGYMSIVADNSGRYLADSWYDWLPVVLPVAEINSYISPIYGAKGSNNVTISDNYAKSNLYPSLFADTNWSTIIGYSIKNSDVHRTNGLTKLVGVKPEVITDKAGNYLQNNSSTSSSVSRNEMIANSWSNITTGDISSSTYVSQNNLSLDETNYNIATITSSAVYQQLGTTNANIYGDFEIATDNTKSILQNGIFKALNSDVSNENVYVLKNLILHENIFSIPEKDNGKNYIKSADELAYALQLDSEETFVLMNTIDLTKRIWNTTKDTSNITIIDNGFDILYIEEISIGNKDTKIKNSDIVNDFGACDAIEKDDSQEKFNSFAQIFYELEGEGNTYKGGTTFTIIKKDQLYLIGFYLHKFKGNNIWKTNLNFQGVTFELGDNIELDFANDFKEPQPDGTFSIQEVISKKLSNYNFGIDMVYSGEHNYFNGIDSYYGNTEKGYDESCYFNGKINGKGKTITIVNGTLFNRLGENAEIYNLNIKAKTSNISLERQHLDFGFVANVNMGTIKNVNVKLLDENGNKKTTLNITKTIKLLNETTGTTGTTGTTKETYVVEKTNVGLICGANQGNVENCTVTNCGEENKIDGLTINFKHKGVTDSETTFDETAFDFYENVGAFVGSNEGIIKFEDTTINSIDIKITNNIEDINTTKTKSLTIALGSICGQNVICSEKTYSDGEVIALGVFGAKVLQSTLNADGEILYSIYIGGIAGISSTKISECSVISFSSGNNGSKAKIGIIIGRFNADLYLEDSTVYGASYHYKCFIPSITKCYGTSHNSFELYGECATLSYKVVEESGVYYIEKSLDATNYEKLQFSTKDGNVYIDSETGENDITNYNNDTNPYSTEATPELVVKKITLTTTYQDIDWTNAVKNDETALENYSGRKSVSLTLDGINFGSEFTIVATEDATETLKIFIDYYKSEIEIKEKTGTQQVQKTDENGNLVFKFTDENGAHETIDNSDETKTYEPVMIDKDVYETVRKYKNVLSTETEYTIKTNNKQETYSEISLSGISANTTITFTITLTKTYEKDTGTTGE